MKQNGRTIGKKTKHLKRLRCRKAKSYMYWICFPLLLFLTLLGVAAINNFLALTAKDEEDEDDDSEDKDGGGNDG